jgi:transcriptional regulator with XRE-family HTH domain
MIIVGIAEGLYGLGLWLTEYISLDIVRDVNEVLLLRRRAGVTQSRLAELAGTSQPTIAAYESGSKVPNLRTLRKLARALGLEARVQFVPALTREDRRSLALHEAIAQRLIEDPVAVTERARKTLSLMIERHPGAAPLLTEWDAILRRPVSEVADLLHDPRPRARDLRQVTPFAGILSTAERTEVYKRFAASEGMTP